MSHSRSPPTVSSTRWTRCSLPRFSTSWLPKVSSTQHTAGCQLHGRATAGKVDLRVSDDGHVHAYVRAPVVIGVDMFRYGAAGAKSHQPTAAPNTVQPSHDLHQIGTLAKIWRDPHRPGEFVSD